MFDLKIRFLTVRFLKWSGSKMTSAIGSSAASASVATRDAKVVRVGGGRVHSSTLRLDAQCLIDAGSWLTTHGSRRRARRTWSAVSREPAPFPIVRQRDNAR